MNTFVTWVINFSKALSLEHCSKCPWPPLAIQHCYFTINSLQKSEEGQTLHVHTHSSFPPWLRCYCPLAALVPFNSISKNVQNEGKKAGANLSWMVEVSSEGIQYKGFNMLSKLMDKTCLRMKGCIKRSQKARTTSRPGT